MVSSGLIAQFDEDTQREMDYLYQLVYAHNNDGDVESRRSRFPNMVDSARKLNDVVTKIKKENSGHLRVVARLFD